MTKFSFILSDHICDFDGDKFHLRTGTYNTLNPFQDIKTTYI